MRRPGKDFNMIEFKLDFNETAGKIKPMNAVNNGPVGDNIRSDSSNFESYKALRIPYARNHDASHCSSYGGEHIVDVHRIFRNFDADECDPASYFFEPTDVYVKNTLDAGTQTFYRLGSSIEHWVKFGTRAPKDFLKWARICEHIIRHYNEGWANGFEYGIEYWEIWNEADCRNPDGSNPCWQGTDEEFLEFYAVVAKHLKATFPSLKIGGPAFCTPWSTPFRDGFLDMIARDNIPFDFYSYHWYGCKLEKLAQTINYARGELDKRGLTGVPTILNEWNYIKAWRDEEYAYSMKTLKALKGASFVAGAMCVGQALPLDMLMYYDARPCAFNGMFSMNGYKPLKTYYTFLAYADLVDLGDYVKCDYTAEDVYICAATNGNEGAVMLTHYADTDSAEPKAVKLDLDGISDFTAEVYVTDEDNNMSLFAKQRFNGTAPELYLNIKLHSVVYVKLVKN